MSTTTGQRTILVYSDELDAAMAADGYAYVDDEGHVLDDVPRRGWYVSVADDGTRVAWRLTDGPSDPEYDASILHVRTDREPALYDGGAM